MDPEKKRRKTEIGTDEWRMYIEDTVRSGIVEFLVLHLLCKKDMYGYEIRQTLAAITDKAFVMREATLYGVLYRLSSRGLITSRREMAGERRFRMYYHIEEDGKTYLKYGEEQLRVIIKGMLCLLDEDKETEVETAE